jgi:hypothetical protein
MIDPNKLRIPHNYVLVKPDEDFETYQMEGKETGILAPLVYKDEKQNEISAKQQHISISGIVYQVPEKLVFNGYKIWELQDRHMPRRDTNTTREPSVQREIDSLRLDSVRFDTEVEVEVGDRVYFEYMAHMMADTYGRWVPTSQGTMMMVKYDDLILAKRDNEVIMLNGNVLVENEVQEADTEGFIKQLHVKDHKTRSHAYAKVRYCGTRVKAYLELRGIRDGNQIAERIIYDPRYAKELEFGLHRIFDEKRLLRIQRKDIYGKVE